jgi:hypothetical protein
MNEYNARNGVAPQSWLQHYLPWLRLFALMLGLLRDEPEIGFDPDELNG